VRYADLEELSALVAEIEPDGKKVPILVKQYLRMGGRLLGFHVDPTFGNTLVALLAADIRTAEERVLRRYLGREGARTFLRAHRQDLPEAV
jgi:putative hemolysin